MNTNKPKLNEYPFVKKVNVYPQRSITSTNPPIRSTVRRVFKTTEDIRKCLIGRAAVEEILPDGSTVRLDFSNFDKDNRVDAKAAAVEAARKAEQEQRAKKEEAERKAKEEARAKAEAERKAKEAAAAAKPEITKDIEQPSMAANNNK